MSSEHLASAQNVLKGNLAGAWDILSGAQGQYPAEVSVRSTAVKIYSFLDILGTGNDVCQLYNANSSPTSRDFTATELTDGTYTSWYVSGTTKVTALYDQNIIGGPSVGVVPITASSSIAPDYDSSDNLASSVAVNPFVKSSIASSSVYNSTLGTVFSGNALGQGATLVMTVKDFTTAPSSSETPLLNIRSNAPTGDLSDAHKALVAVVGDGDVGASVRDSSFTQFSASSDDPIDSTLRMYTGIINKTDSSTTTVRAFKGDSEIANDTTTTISDTINLTTIKAGGSIFKFQTAIIFNKALTESDVNNLKNELESL